MLGVELYPTPPPVTRKMLDPYTKLLHGYRYLTSKVVCDPSAGRGHILDYITEEYRSQHKTMYAIEIDPELRSILAGKGYRVIHDDWLTYDEPYNIDLFVMNPPFSKGAEHLLKTWEVLKAGDIACLLNAETVRNPFSEVRKKVKLLIEKHGSVEFIGRPFERDVERPANVECCIVWLHKDPPKTVADFDSSTFDKDSAVRDAEFAANPLASRSVIATLVAQFNAARQILIERDALQAKYLFYIKGVCNPSETKIETTLNEQIDALKRDFWRYVFEKTEIGKKTTSGFQQQFYRFQSQTQAMSFSEKNVIAVLEMFLLSYGDILQECIAQVFDKATEYHADNKVFSERWKTNKSYMVAKKIIIPNGVELNDYGSWSLRYGEKRDFFDDFDKCISYITGVKRDDILTITRAIEARCELLNSRSRGAISYDMKFCSEHFELRFFKKGTVHLRFLDEDIWARFNQAAAQGKKWIGPGY